MQQESSLTVHEWVDEPADKALYAGTRSGVIKWDKHTVSPTAQFAQGTMGKATFVEYGKHCVVVR